MKNEDKHNKKRFTVKVLGEELTITGSVSRDYVELLVKYINNIGSEITQAYPHLPRRRLFGLTIVNIADELYKLKQKHQGKVRKNEHLLREKEILEKKINSLQKEYKELSLLLEEVDG